MGRPLMKRTPTQIVKIVTSIRTRNNKLWMGILAVALASKPRKTKRLIRQITANDQEVSKWMNRV